MNDDFFLGVDWGGTRIKLGVISPRGSLLQHTMLSPENNARAEEIYPEIVRKLQQLIDRPGSLLGIGLGLTGPTDPDRGVVLLPGKVNGLEGFPLVPLLKKEFGVPVWADNDGRVAMYAEKYAGLARDCRWAATVTIGTGVGSGVMLDGRILSDPHLQFGTQIGHLVIDQSDDQLCLTGARGTGEMLCSATALVLAVRSGLQRGIPSTLSEAYWADPHSIHFQAIIEQGVALGDRLCVDELKRWTARLGWMLVNVVHAYSPEVIVLAGGAMAAAPYFLETLQFHVSQHIFRYPAGDPVPIVISELGDHVGVIGAALMVQERLQASG